MKTLKNIGIDILIFAIAFFGTELTMRLDVLRANNLFVEFIVFLVIYVLAYVIIKFLWSYAQKNSK